MSFERPMKIDDKTREILVPSQSIVASCATLAIFLIFSKC